MEQLGGGGRVATCAAARGWSEHGGGGCSGRPGKCLRQWSGSWEVGALRRSRGRSSWEEGEGGLRWGGRGVSTLGREGVGRERKRAIDCENAEGTMAVVTRGLGEK